MIFLHVFTLAASRFQRVTGKGSRCCHKNKLTSSFTDLSHRLLQTDRDWRMPMATVCRLRLFQRAPSPNDALSRSKVPRELSVYPLDYCDPDKVILTLTARSMPGIEQYDLHLSVSKSENPTGPVKVRASIKAKMPKIEARFRYPAVRIALSDCTILLFLHVLFSCFVSGIAQTSTRSPGIATTSSCSFIDASRRGA